MWYIHALVFRVQKGRAPDPGAGDSRDADLLCLRQSVPRRRKVRIPPLVPQSGVPSATCRCSSRGLAAQGQVPPPLGGAHLVPSRRRTIRALSAKTGATLATGWRAGGRAARRSGRRRVGLTVRAWLGAPRDYKSRLLSAVPPLPSLFSNRPASKALALGLRECGLADS